MAIISGSARAAEQGFRTRENQILNTFQRSWNPLCLLQNLVSPTPLPPLSLYPPYPIITNCSKIRLVLASWFGWQAWGPRVLSSSPDGCWIKDLWGRLSLSSFRGQKNEYQCTGREGHSISGTATLQEMVATWQPSSHVQEQNNWILCIFNLRSCKSFQQPWLCLCNWIGRHQLTCRKTVFCCSCISPLSLPFHPAIYHR